MRVWQQVEQVEDHIVSCYCTPAGGAGVVLLTATTGSYPWDGESVKSPPPTLYSVRLIERIPAQVRREELVQRLGQIRKDPVLRKWKSLMFDGKKQPMPVPPACIIGAPAWLRLNSREWANTGGILTLAQITDSGTTVTRDGASYCVPRAVLGGPLLRLFAEGRVHIAPALDLAAALTDELRSFDPARPAERWHQNPQDLLSLSLSLALWWDEERTRYGGALVKLQGF